MKEVISLIGSLLLVVLVLVLTYYATRWYARRAGKQTGSGKYIKVVDRAVLGAGASVAIVQVDGRCYMIGIGEKSVNLLSELPDLNVSEDSETPETIPFSQAFRQMLDKTRGQSRDKGGDDRL